MRTKNKKTYRNLIILIVIIIALIIIGISMTMGRYTGDATAEMTTDIALFVFEEGLQEGSLLLSGLYPREAAFEEFEFTIANTDGEKTAQVSIDYTAELKITTNLPLEIDIYKKTSSEGTYSKLEDEDEITNEIVLDESEQCYIRKITIKSGSFTHSQAQTDTYKLSVKFPPEYKTEEEFAGMVDHVSIVVDAKQKVAEAS